MKQFYYLLSVIFLAGCSTREYLTSEELSQYIISDDSGLHQSIEVNNTKIEVSYRPTDLWVYQELNNSDADSSRVNPLRRKYSPYYYFILSLSRNEKEALHQTGDFGEYSDLVQTMSFRMPQYVTLTTAKQDTIPVGDFMLNRTYGMSASTDLLFVFNKEEAINKEWVQFNLNEFGLNVGNQRFRFKTSDLERAPRIYKI